MLLNLAILVLWVRCEEDQIPPWIKLCQITYRRALFATTTTPKCASILSNSQKTAASELSKEFGDEVSTSEASVSVTWCEFK